MRYGTSIIALLIIFLGIGLGIRGRSFKRRTGYSVWKGFTKKRHGTELVAGKLLATGFTAIITGAVLDASGVLHAIGVLSAHGVRLAGIGISVVGFAITQWGAADMKDSWRVDVDEDDVTELITEGLFRYCRNPIYLGIVLVATGFTIAVPNWVSIAGVLTVIAAIEIMVRRIEEPSQAERHGSAFADYAAEVGRFIPLIGRMRLSDASPAKGSASDRTGEK